MTWRSRRTAAVLGIVLAVAAGCSGSPDQQAAPGGTTPVTAPHTTTGAVTGAPSPSGATGGAPPAAPVVTSWTYQLQGYDGGKLTAIAAGPHDLAVVDLARDAHTGWFTAEEITEVRSRGKTVLAYFEIGSIEHFRPEYRQVNAVPGLVLNDWPDWPDESFVRFWEEQWWQLAVRPRLDRALTAGFDGVYLDTPLAYEEIDLARVPGETRDSLARRMAGLIVRISTYAKARRPGFWIVPQNSPELRLQAGYTAAVDGIGMEELYFLATDRPCKQDWCAENLAHTRALRDAGKLVLAVDYAREDRNIRAACDRYAAERFAGCVSVRDLDRSTPPCTRTGTG